MDKIDLKGMSVKELLLTHGEILKELNRRNVTRTKNNPVGDYAEWLVTTLLGYQLQTNSNSGFDALGTDGTRYQVKARRVTAKNKSRQLGVIRNLNTDCFDKLIALIFTEDFTLDTALVIPREIIADYATYRQHANGHVLHLRGKILLDDRVESIAHLLKI